MVISIKFENEFEKSITSQQVNNFNNFHKVFEENGILIKKEEYKNNEAPTLNHFYEKLLLLKDKMNTETGKKIAQERHRYMEGFLSHFYAEWDGEK